LVGSKLWHLYVLGTPSQLVASQALFYVALAAMISGVQLFTVGFVAELVGRNAPDRHSYRVAERVGSGSLHQGAEAARGAAWPKGSAASRPSCPYTSSRKFKRSSASTQAVK